MREHAYWTGGLAILGVLAVVALVTIAFLPSASEYLTLKKTDPLQIGSPAFIAAFSTATHGTVQTGDIPTILNNGDEFIPAVVASIDQAQHSINITNFIWTDGSFSDQLFVALDAAAKRGVQVRILVDADGSSMPGAQTKALQALGGKVETFRPITLVNLDLLYRRDHRRAVIIDGETAYTGGIAFDDQWLGDGITPGYWRDMMFEVHGALAQDLQGAFSDIWIETTGEVIAGSDFFPFAPLAPHSGAATYVEIFSAPTGYFEPVRDAFTLSILSAKKSLYITNTYLLPDAETMTLLEEKARAGVDVRILVPGSDNDPEFAEFAGEANYEALLKAGVRIYIYNNLIHTKTVTIDGVWSLIGSANFDNRSRALNDEAVLGVASPQFASELQDTFMQDLTHAKELTLQEWDKRGLYSRLRSFVCLLFAKQL
jgi:cardiolipin synthase